jgi:N-acetylmuramoyl-L-alanine amidase
MKSFLIFFLFASLCLAQQQSSVKLEYEKRLILLPAIEKEGMLFIAAKSLADSLKFKTDYSEGRLVISGPESDIIISPDNPFLILTDNRGSKIKAHQLPLLTIRLMNDIYIPFIYAAPVINEVLGTNLTFNSDKNIISSSSPEAEVFVSEIIEETPGFDITGVKIDEKANGTLIRIISEKEIRFYSSSFSDGILSVIIRGADADPEISNSILFSGLVKGLEIKNSGGDAELNFSLGSEYSASEIIKADQGNDLLITIHNKIFTGKDAAKGKDKWNFDVVVLDAGHGGKDAGAIGVNGAREKDINLAIVLMLGRMIEEKLPGVRVEYTRKDDTFVELYKRGKIANEKNGKLFISIHCNSTPNKNSNASGFEVYLLRPGRTQEAISIAERENSVISYEEDPRRYQQLTDENFILVSMAQSAYMKYSEKFAENLDRHFSSGFGLPNRGVKQAGFYVLVGASMPGVLIETGFLSNRVDAAYLNSKKGQEKTAELILQSIKSFKTYYESVLGLEK